MAHPLKLFSSSQPKTKQVKTDAKQKNVQPCPWLCNLVPTNVPSPGETRSLLHPHKDVFVLKVAKIGPNGDRRCKMELELVTPKGPEKKGLSRIDTRETQCEPDPPLCGGCARPTMRTKKKL